MGDIWSIAFHLEDAVLLVICDPGSGGAIYTLPPSLVVEAKLNYLPVIVR